MKKRVFPWLLSGGVLLGGSSARQIVTFSVIPSTSVSVTSTNWVHGSERQSLKIDQALAGRTNIVTVTEK